MISESQIKDIHVPVYVTAGVQLPPYSGYLPPLNNLDEWFGAICGESFDGHVWTFLARARWNNL